MLTLQRCRELLGSDCPLTDEELTAVRDTLYEVAKMAIDSGGMLDAGDPVFEPRDNA